MSYLAWFEDHAQKHEKIMKKLLSKDFSQEQIIKYFDFDNMVKEENDFCPLYKDNKKCHDMESLNCYLCACPNFRFKDEGIKQIDDKTQHSYCSIESRDGKQGIYGEVIHQDCSKCGVPHKLDYVRKHFDISWKKIMRKCSL